MVADWVLPDGDGIDVADNAVLLGARTLIVTGHLSDLPDGAAADARIALSAKSGIRSDQTTDIVCISH
jgi:hypothetical protein